MKLADAQLGFTFDDLMLVPQFSEVKSRKEPDISTDLGGSKYKIPIVSSPMNTVTEGDMIKTMVELGGTGVLHRYVHVEDQLFEIKDYSMFPGFVAVGATGDYLKRVSALYKAGVRRFCVDVANGHSKVCINAVYEIVKLFDSQDVQIMAGNVCTKEGTLRLYNAGADIIRVGIGPGSMCTTRLVTGHGVPQLTAIEECASLKAEFENVSILADGGIRSSGDIVKALAAGADAVMIGGLLAGTDQTPGKIKNDEETGQAYKLYAGMASEEGRGNWFDKSATSFVPEGSSINTPHKGDAVKILERLVGGLKVGMSYVGATSLEELREKARWMRVTENGRIEGTPNRKMFKR